MGHAKLIRGPRIEVLYRCRNPAHILKLQLLRLTEHNVAARHAINVENIGAVAKLIRHNLGCAGRNIVGAGNSRISGSSLSAHVTQA